MRFQAEYTDTFAGEANYSWVHRVIIDMPELTHYGYDGATNYVACNRKFERSLIRKAKRALGISIPHKREDQGDTICLQFPKYACRIVFIEPLED